MLDKWRQHYQVHIWDIKTACSNISSNQHIKTSITKSCKRSVPLSLLHITMECFTSNDASHGPRQFLSIFFCSRENYTFTSLCVSLKNRKLRFNVNKNRMKLSKFKVNLKRELTFKKKTKQ